MVARLLPKTDMERESALSRAKRKNDHYTGALPVLNADTVSRLNHMQPLFAEKTQNRSVALAHQAHSTKAVNALRVNLRMHISHFIQVFNLGVKRGVYDSSSRTLFGIDMNSESTPYLQNDANLSLWSHNIITGDAIRVAAGEAPMLNPTTAELKAVYDAFEQSKISQSNLKDVYDNSQEAVAALRKSADSLILRIWNEVEAFFSEDEISSKRRKASQWGVVYKNLQGEKEEETD